VKNENHFLNLLVSTNMKEKNIKQATTKRIRKNVKPIEVFNEI